MKPVKAWIVIMWDDKTISPASWDNSLAIYTTRKAAQDHIFFEGEHVVRVEIRELKPKRGKK